MNRQVKFKHLYLIVIAFLASAMASFVLANDTDELKKLESYRPMIVEMESTLKLPKSAHSLASYARTYAIAESNGHRKIVGEYRYNPEHSGIRFIKYNELIRTADGGCSVIRIEYNLKKKILIGVNCGGEA